MCASEIELITRQRAMNHSKNCLAITEFDSVFNADNMSVHEILNGFYSVFNKHPDLLASSVFTIDGNQSKWDSGEYLDFYNELLKSSDICNDENRQFKCLIEYDDDTDSGDYIFSFHVGFIINKAN